MIRGMLRHRPEMSLQAILAHFSWPGRDINSRVIGEIRDWRRFNVPAASAADVDRFLAMSGAVLADAASFVRAVALPPQRSLLLDAWPVGQGLFASGAIQGGAKEPLNWVYDCGTLSKGEILTAALDAFEAQQRRIGANEVRLCVLSHFDTDHISGIVSLIGRIRVRTLLMPYIPLWRRLLIALEEGVGADDDLFGFFIDPVTWLAERGGGRIGEIIFVPGGGPDDLTPGEPEPDSEDRVDPDELGTDLKAEDDPVPPAEAEDDPIVSAASSVSVRFLRRGGRLVAPLFWEFVPYNDVKLAPKVTRLFRATAAPLIATLRDERDDAEARANALAQLKALYESRFKGSVERNLISLYLYSGPIGSRLRLGHGSLGGLPLETTDFAQMYTGDGLLNDVTRYGAFERFYRGRLSRAKVFQVMHHGARGSWHAGLAAKVAPEVSIFSSDPARSPWHHPHEEVLRDFWTYGPRRVDETQGYFLRRRLVF